MIFWWVRGESYYAHANAPANMSVHNFDTAVKLSKLKMKLWSPYDPGSLLQSMRSARPGIGLMPPKWRHL